MICLSPFRKVKAIKRYHTKQWQSKHICNRKNSFTIYEHTYTASSVSYTHLDVYKRQVSCRTKMKSGNEFGIHYCVSIYCSNISDVSCFACTRFFSFRVKTHCGEQNSCDTFEDVHNQPRAEKCLVRVRSNIHLPSRTFCCLRTQRNTFGTVLLPFVGSEHVTTSKFMSCIFSSSNF